MCQINIVVCDVYNIIICMCGRMQYLSVMEMCQVRAIDLPCVDWKKWLVVSPECPSEFGHILQPIILLWTGQVTHTEQLRPVLYNSAKVASKYSDINNHPIYRGFLGDFLSLSTERADKLYTQQVVATLDVYWGITYIPTYRDMYIPSAKGYFNISSFTVQQIDCSYYG